MRSALMHYYYYYKCQDLGDAVTKSCGAPYKINKTCAQV